MTPDGVGEVVDFMPVIQGDATDRHRLVRVVRVVRGAMRFVLDCQPRFDYGRASHKTEITENGVAFHGDDGLELALHITRRPGVTAENAVRAEHHDDGVRAVVDVTAGQDRRRGPRVGARRPTTRAPSGAGARDVHRDA